MNALTDNAFELPDSTPDARLLELTAQVRALQSELRRQEASASENARLFAQMHARLRELSALNRVTNAVIGTLELKELLEVSLQQTVQVTDSDTGSIMLIDPHTGQLRIAASHGLSSEVVDNASIAVGEGVAGWVAQNKKPLLVPNVADDPRFSLTVPRQEIKSAMSVPILSKYDALGVLNVARSSSMKPFSSQDLQLLSTLAGQISLAVQNARLFAAVSRRNEELSTLMELGHQLNSTLSLHDVLDIIVEQTSQILQGDACCLFLRDDRHEVLRARAYRRLSTRFVGKVRGKLGHGLIGDVAVSGQPLYLPDVSRAPRLEYPEAHREEGLASMLCVPVRFGGQSLGALAVYTTKTRRFADHEMNMLTAIAGQGAIAIQNAENYQHQRGIAELVQRNLTPHITLSSDGVEIGHRYLPAKQVGGDYYDVFDLPDDRIGIVMADVAGKSVSAAVHTAKGKYFIRALGHSAETSAEVLARTNALITADPSIETFISVFYAVIEPDRRTLRYSNAGHPPPLLARADGTIIELSEADILLGIISDPVFRETTVALEAGDTLVMTTDGVTEARHGASMYGNERLAECLKQHLSESAQFIANAICDEVTQFGGKHMRDDVAVLVVRIK